MNAGASFSTVPAALIDAIIGFSFGRSVAKSTFDASSHIGALPTR